MPGMASEGGGPVGPPEHEFASMPAAFPVHYLYGVRLEFVVVLQGGDTLQGTVDLSDTESIRFSTKYTVSEVR